MRYKIAIFLYLFSTLCFLQSLGSEVTSILDKKISLNVQNESLQSVLRKVEQAAGINFAYMSGLFDKDKKITIKADKLTVRVILQKLITNPNVLLYVLDNKIVFYMKDEEPPGDVGTSVSLLATKPADEKSYYFETTYDTVRIAVVDSLHVVVFDSSVVIVYDTVKVSAPQFTQKEDSVRQTRYLTFGLGFYRCLVFETFGSSSLSGEVSRSESIRPSQSVFLRCQYHRGRLGLACGIGYRSISWDANYDLATRWVDSSKVVGYDVSLQWNKTLVDVYYTYMPGIDDSTLVFVYDSNIVETKRPVFGNDSMVARYQGINTIRHVSIPLGISFSLLKVTSFDMGACASINGNFMVAARGKTLVNNRSPQLIDLRSAVKDFYASGSVGLCLGYSFKKIRMDTFAGVSVPFTSPFRYNYPARRKNMEISAGMFISCKLFK